MADYYTKFSEILTLDNDEERKWWEEKIAAMRAADEASGDGHDPENGEPCHLEIQDGSLWAYADGDSADDPDGLALAVQDFFKAFKSPSIFTIGFSNSCSKPEAGVYGGGGVVVSADAITWVNVRQWMDEEVKRRTLPADGKGPRILRVCHTFSDDHGDFALGDFEIPVGVTDEDAAKHFEDAWSSFWESDAGSSDLDHVAAVKLFIAGMFNDGYKHLGNDNVFCLTLPPPDEA